MAPELIQHPWDEHLLQAFGPSVEANPWGWGTAMEVLHGCHCFEYVQGGQRALLAVRPVVRDAGTRLDVAGLVSLGDRIQAKPMGQALGQLAQHFEARALAMTTLRPHVAAVARRIGFEQTGVLMIKRLDALQ